MNSSNGELIILLIGIATALSTFFHYFAVEGEERRSWVFMSLLVLNIAAQLGTEGSQYHNAVLTRREQDRRISEALYAFNQTEERLLLKVADPRVADGNAYVVGYWYFKRGSKEYSDHGNTDLTKKYLSLAKTYLDLAIHNKRFLPQSYYILGTINRTTQSDWTEARQDFDTSIREDADMRRPIMGALFFVRKVTTCKGRSTISNRRPLLA